MCTDGWTGVCACHRERYDFFTDGFVLDRRHICVTDMWGGEPINADTIGTYQSYIFQGFELFKMCCLAP